MNPSQEPRTSSEFEEAALEEESESLVQEFLSFLAHNKKWWLLPILLVMVVMFGLIALASSPAAPFIYTLF